MNVVVEILDYKGVLISACPHYRGSTVTIIIGFWFLYSLAYLICVLCLNHFKIILRYFSTIHITKRCPGIAARISGKNPFTSPNHISFFFGKKCCFKFTLACSEKPILAGIWECNIVSYLVVFSNLDKQKNLPTSCCCLHKSNLYFWQTKSLRYRQIASEGSKNAKSPQKGEK